MAKKRPAALNIGIDLNFEVLKDFAEASQNLAMGSHTVVIDGGAVSSVSAVTAATTVNSDGYRQLPLNVARVANIAEIDDGAGWIVRNDEAGSNLAVSPEMACIDASLLLIHGDSVDWLRVTGLTGESFVYCDPPYVMSTRSSQRPIYTYEYDDSDHVRLLTVLKGLDCPVMVSGYWSELYADMLQGWHTRSFESVTRGGTMATEWLWMNYPKPTALHDYQYLGDDFRERERIKRKKDRWVNRFKKTKGLERQAILWALSEAGIL